MSGNEALIHQFYQSFQRRDWQSMQACYHPQIEFSDPVFQNLTARQAFAMWHMLTTSASELKITWSKVTADETEGQCHWEATYLFSATGKKVRNQIDAHFKFSDGLIIVHEDQFDLWKWSGMALGLSGRLLGWSSYLQAKIRSGAMKSLYRFIDNHPEYK